MNLIRPETFLILISICSIFAWETRKLELSDATEKTTVDHEALLAEKDEEIRNLKAALAAAKFKLGGTTNFLQQARTIDLKTINRKKSIFRRINEKFSEKARKIKLQLKKLAQMLNQKRRQLKNRIKKFIGKEDKLYNTYNQI